MRTGRTIKRRTVTTIPITQNGIDLVHKMAENDNMRDGLKIETKSGIILYDSSWIAGVDYENNNENDDITIEDHENGENDEIVENDSNYDEMNPNEIVEILEETHPDLVGVHNNIIENATEVVEIDQNIFENIIENNQNMAETTKMAQIMKK